VPDLVVSHDAGESAAAFDLPPESHNVVGHDLWSIVADEAHPKGQQTQSTVVPGKVFRSSLPALSRANRPAAERAFRPA
jgi:hypothetical protein